MGSIEFNIPSIVIVSIQLIVLFIQINNFTKNLHDKNLLKFVVLSSIFLLYNSVAIIGGNNSYALSQTLNIGLGSYYFYYVFSRLVAIKSPIGHIAILFTGLILTLLFSISINHGLSSNTIGDPTSLLMILFFCIGSLLSIFGKGITEREKRNHIFSGIVLIIYVTVAIAIYSINQNHISINLFINVFFFTALYDYVVKVFFNEQSNFFEVQNISILDNPTEDNIESINDIEPESIELSKEQLLQLLEELLVKEFGTLLTGRELEVAKLLLKGYSYVELQDILGLSYNTVTTHTSSIYQKTGTTDHVGFIYYWLIHQKKINFHRS